MLTRRERVIAALLVVAVAVAVPTAVMRRPHSARTAAGNVRGDAARSAVQTRSDAVRELLNRRAAAVLHHDLAAYLADIDPMQPAFRARQARSFDDLADVDFASWSYSLDPTRVQPRSNALDRRYGTWWSPSIALHYKVRGYDLTPTQDAQGLTFVERRGRWWLASDDDFPDTPTQAEIWDAGPVTVLRGTACAVLTHASDLTLAAQIRRDCDAAVPAVTAVWGRGWAQRVVLLVPKSPGELRSLVPDAGDLSNIEAVATAELIDPTTGYHPVGNRVVINPSTFPDLRAIGSRIVLTHEVTHVASRSVTGPHEPTWFVEGLADYVAFLHAGLPLSVSAEELQASLRSGSVPRELPVNGDYRGGRADLAAIYEEGWLAVVQIAATYGQATMLKLYRDIGRSRAADAVGIAFATDLHTTVAAFTTSWRAHLISSLG